LRSLESREERPADAGAAHVIVSDEEDMVERVMTITAVKALALVFDPVWRATFEL